MTTLCTQRVPFKFINEVFDIAGRAVREDPLVGVGVTFCRVHHIACTHWTHITLTVMFATKAET